MGKRMKKVLASAMSLSMVASMAMSGVSATTSRVIQYVIKTKDNTNDDG